jgi:hypothetical protein
MLHVLVKTNWIVDVAAPEHHRQPDAVDLLARAKIGELQLHVPAFCFTEARRAIQKFRPRNEADAVRHFLKRSQQTGMVSQSDAQATLRILSQFESSVRGELDQTDATFDKIRSTPNVSVFPLTDSMLKLSVELSLSEVSLQPFDGMVLAAVLGRRDEFLSSADARFVFCERDKDLQPWDNEGRPTQPLASLYDQRQIWVYADFSMTGLQPPSEWPSI